MEKASGMLSVGVFSHAFIDHCAGSCGFLNHSLRNTVSGLRQKQ